MLAGVPDLLRKCVNFKDESMVLGESMSTEDKTPLEAAIMADAETGGVADLELLELSPQLFSSIMTRAGDFRSTLDPTSMMSDDLEDGGGWRKLMLEAATSLRKASRSSARFL